MATFQQLALHAGIGLILASAFLLVAGHRLRRSHWFFSLLAISALGTAAWAAQWALTGNGLPLAPTLGGWVVLGAMVTACFEKWNSAGHAAFVAACGSVAAFLIYAVYVVIAAELGPWSMVFAGLLLVMQFATLLLLVAHTFEILDATCRIEWRRHAAAKIVSGFTPKVSLHVPTHNEPPELVIETLEALSRLDYPNFEVLVIDNNTQDESLWRPVEAFCRRLGPRFRFFHLLPWPGYKSGALNYALSQTAPDATIVGVVDADYHVEPGYLRDLVGHFAEPDVAFVQTPQDYRDTPQRGRYGRALYLAYDYFFRVSMSVRNERNSIIFAGTMGLIRRSALQQVGGWDEWCITEDAEVAVRLLDAGHSSVYVSRTYGRGLMPLDYAGLKKQRFRWAFGGMQLLRRHARRLLFPSRSGRLTVAQRFDFLTGGLQWLNDPMALAFSVFLLIGAGALLAGGSLYIQPLAGAVMLISPLFILFAVLRFLWAFRVRSQCTWREATDALCILLGLTWVVSLACLRGLFSREGVFLRTPKSKTEQPSALEALRYVRGELALGSLCLGVAVAVALIRPFDPLSARGVVIFLLLWQAATYLSAVRCCRWSYLQELEATPRFWRRSFRTLGHAWGRLSGERGTAVWVTLAATLLSILFYMAVIGAPLGERIQRLDPLAHFLPARSILRPAVSPVEESAAVLVREADAARRASPESALELWHPDGVIRDTNFTPDIATDDREWVGRQQIRARYREEFAQRRYQRLRHDNLRVELRGDEVVITNDLFAVYQDGERLREVRLRSSDRWTLRREDGVWRIVSLELNRAPAGAADVAEGGRTP